MSPSDIGDNEEPLDAEELTNLRAQLERQPWVNDTPRLLATIAARDEEIARLVQQRADDYVRHCSACAVVEARVAQMEKALETIERGCGYEAAKNIARAALKRTP